MCGIAGFLGRKTNNTNNIAKAMAQSIHHRGPDDQGIWIDEKTNLALIHTRLSILDLSPAGHQPMHSPHQRFVIAFNGEIYNHLHLRKELESTGFTSWHGHSDTETLLASFEKWGIENTLKKMVGMFAIALWDKVENTLYLARDRMGEKPLYYGFQKGTFLYGSELKALKKHPSFENSINRDAIALQFRHNYIPDPFSIYNGINKLTPGHLLKLHAQTNTLTVTPYWELKDHIQNTAKKNFVLTPNGAVAHMESLLKTTIKEQMLSDVPLGAFLSGGIDSSLVTALMQSQSGQPIKTFTIGFDEKGYNEAEYAKAVARHLKTEHTELYVTEREALDVIPLLPTLYDEPFSDSSQIPTFLVSQMTKHHVSVALSGDGADELFGGYNRYSWADNIWKRTKFLPHGVRSSTAKLITHLPPEKLNKSYELLSSFLPKKLHFKNVGDKMHKLSSLLSLSSREDIYFNLISHWKSPEDIVIGAKEPSSLRNHLSTLQGFDFVSQMMYADATSYLCGDILVKVDRAAMGVSLETRAPFLDHRIVEAAWNLPLSMKIHEGKRKWILRQILYKYIPKELIERPKMGFGAPIDSWLRGPLRDWAETLLDENRLKREGYLNPLPIRKKWEEHLSRKHNWQYDLWDILMFQAWLENNQKTLV